MLFRSEMQSGFARTGYKFGYEYYGVKPDLICCGKGMGGGMPISGVIGKRAIMDLPEVGNMSSTHSGNPLMCAAGLAVLEEIESKNLVDESSKKGLVLERELSKLVSRFPSFLRGTFGKGLIRSLIFNSTESRAAAFNASEFSELCFRAGLLVVHTGRESVKIGPPLTIPESAILEAVEVMEDVLRKLCQR